jgi:polyisoprenoid-binding protein YceI
MQAFTISCRKNQTIPSTTYKTMTMKVRQLIMHSMVIAGIGLAGTWNVDSANAKVSFSVKGPFGKVNGTFSGLKATIQFDDKDLAGSSVKASIDAATISTGIGLRNHHLKSEEQWLNTDKYPQITFQSKKIERAANGYKATGDLTLKGVIKPVEIPFTFTPNGGGGEFKGQFTIKREDYNVGKEGGSVGDMIDITLEVPVKK